MMWEQKAAEKVLLLIANEIDNKFNKAFLGSKLECLAFAELFHPCLIFVGAYPSGVIS
jgi:hypothetical protein